MPWPALLLKKRSHYRAFPGEALVLSHSGKALSHLESKVLEASAFHA